MDDFASASMLRLLLRAAAADGLAIATLPAWPPVGAHVPRQHKQQVVGALVQAGGLPLLLRLARQVQHIAGEPLHRALVGARDPHEFLLRWQRLERHVHARHRVVALAVGPRRLMLQHQALPGVAAPLAAESVAVLGVWIGALQAVGTAGLRVRLGRQPVIGPGASARWTDGPVQHWRLDWTASAGVRAADDGGATADLPPLADMAWPWAEPAAGLARWLAQDPAGSPRIANAAAALGLPPRTLQRHLAQAGSSFTALLGEVRVRLAAAWLVQAASPLAEIGFACGYADQAHFTREFTRRAGLSPARFRAAARPW